MLWYAVRPRALQSKLGGRRRLAVQEAAAAAAAAVPSTASRQLVQLEVTMFACRENATQASPGCEQALLEAVLSQGLQQEGIATQLEAAGEARECQGCVVVGCIVHG